MEINTATRIGTIERRVPTVLRRSYERLRVKAIKRPHSRVPIESALLFNNLVVINPTAVVVIIMALPLNLLPKRIVPVLLQLPLAL